MEAASVERSGPPRSPKGGYGLPEVQRALLAIAFHAGNTGKAAEDLAEDGLPIPASTLWQWSRRTRVSEYEQVRRDILPQIGAQVADEHRALAQRQMKLSHKLTERLEKEAHELDLRDVSTALRNTDVGAGIHTSRARELQGDYATPSKQTEATLKGLVNALRARGADIQIEAEVVEEAVVVEEAEETA